MALSAGELNQLIRFERTTVTTNEFGEEVAGAWTPAAIGTNGQVWAKRTNQLSAMAEAVASGAEAYREQVRFDIRGAVIDPSWRIVDVRTGRIYDIKSVGTGNDRSETAIIAVAGLNQGG